MTWTRIGESTRVRFYRSGSDQVFVAVRFGKHPWFQMRQITREGAKGWKVIDLEGDSADGHTLPSFAAAKRYTLRWLEANEEEVRAASWATRF